MKQLTILLGIAVVAGLCILWWMRRPEQPLRSQPSQERKLAEPQTIPLH